MGVYRFQSGPLGIPTTPGEYQARTAHQVLEGYNLDRAVVYIDGTVIYGKNENVFLVILDMVVGRVA